MKIYLGIIVMAATTYLIRLLPLLLVRGRIRSRFLRSFLHYVPIACLTAMTFPGILYATDHVVSGAVGLAVAALLALRSKSLVTVAVAGSVCVFLTEQLLGLL